MTETRKYLNKYYKAYSALIGGKYQANYCIWGGLTVWK
jgi:hypothetical protein